MLGGTIEVDESLAGRTGRCERCDTRFELTNSDVTPGPANAAGAQGRPPAGEASSGAALSGPEVWQPGDVILSGSLNDTPELLDIAGNPALFAPCETAKGDGSETGSADANDFHQSIEAVRLALDGNEPIEGAECLRRARGATRL